MMDVNNIDALLRAATTKLLVAGSPTARLDAELLLCHVLDRPRTWLYMWGDRTLNDEDSARFALLLARREAGEPVAYLIGVREFWGLTLETTSHTLIPRPDTELLVEAALMHADSRYGDLLDLGTGTGAVALAFASERPEWHITGVDRIPEAVTLARRNAERLSIPRVRFLESDWFTALAGKRFDIIVSNPPYIADDDEHLNEGDVRFEPRSALVAPDDGLADLYCLVKSAHNHLHAGGWLLLEHGWTQASAVCAMLESCGYREVQHLCDLGGQPRVSLGQMSTESGS